MLFRSPLSFSLLDYLDYFPEKTAHTSMNMDSRSTDYTLSVQTETLSHTKSDPLGSLAFIPASVKQQAVLGEFIDFRDLLPVKPMVDEDHYHLYMTSEFSLSRHHPTSHAVIDCFSTWLTAWNKYERFSDWS